MSCTCIFGRCLTVSPTYQALQPAHADRARDRVFQAEHVTDLKKKKQLV